MERKWVLCCDSGATKLSLQWCDVKNRNKTPRPLLLVLSNHSFFSSREDPYVVSFPVLRATLQIGLKMAFLCSPSPELRAGSPTSLCHTPSHISVGSHHPCPVEVVAWVAMKEKTGSTFECFSHTYCNSLPLSWLVYSSLYFCPGYISDASIPVSSYPPQSITDFSLFTFHDVCSK